MAKKKKRRNYIGGTIQINKRGFAFVTPEEVSDPKHLELGDIFIGPESQKNAMNGDKVEVDLIPEYLWGNSPEGIVVNVVDRKFTEVVGTFDKSKKFGFVIPDDKGL